MALGTLRARRFALAFACACACFAAAAGLGGRLAGASEMGSDPVTDAVPSAVQQRVEETAAAYDAAVIQRAAVEDEVEACRERIAQTEALIPAAQDRAADALAVQYKYAQGQNGLLELVLSADSFNEFIATLRYLDSVTQHQSNQLAELVALTEQLEAEQAELDAALAEAQAQEQAAEAALAEAQEARAEAQRQAAEEAARQEAARQAAAAAVAAAGSDGGAEASSTYVDSSAGAASSDASYDQAVADAYYEESSTTVDWSSDRDAFVAQWGARIDAYLAGSPLAGYGSTFAAAAWDYGVDPRWSPAIAYAESSLGAYCFRSYNAWGWGSVSWSSWSEAIYAHVAGLARGYGYTISYSSAQKYCPSNADHWYSVVSTQMSYI